MGTFRISWSEFTCGDENQEVIPGIPVIVYLIHQAADRDSKRGYVTCILPINGLDTGTMESYWQERPKQREVFICRKNGNVVTCGYCADEKVSI